MCVQMDSPAQRYSNYLLSSTTEAYPAEDAAL